MASNRANPNKIRIRQIRSTIGCPEKQRKVVRGLGFKRLQQVVERPDTPAIRGMVFKVKHLVEVLEQEDES
jgi:large subunit ribosomal protein L30